MIYEYPSSENPIKQGDIFIGLPCIDFSLKEISLVENEGTKIVSWDSIAEKDEPFALLCGGRVTNAIVISQDCDASNSLHISLCEIVPFKTIDKGTKDWNSPSRWSKHLTQHARINQKWFYLPPDNSIFSEKMAVDFRSPFRLRREDLLTFIHRRKGRPEKDAGEHFRERISEFFRRYPYNEWYPLNKEEFTEYKKQYPDVSPYPYQDTDNAEQ